MLALRRKQSWNYRLLEIKAMLFLLKSVEFVQRSIWKNISSFNYMHNKLRQVKISQLSNHLKIFLKEE